MSDDTVVHVNRWRDFNDAAIFTEPETVPHTEQLSVFLDVVFGSSDGLILIRSFVDKGQGFDGKPIWIEADCSRCEAGHLRRLGSK